MSNRKSFKVSEEEYKKLQRMKAIDAENTQKNREITIRKNNLSIKQYERMISDKNTQINQKNYTEATESFVDGKKPAFMLQNEIDELNESIIALKEVNDAIKAEYEAKHEKT